MVNDGVRQIVCWGDWRIQAPEDASNISPADLFIQDLS